MNTFLLVSAILVYFIPYIIAGIDPNFRQRPVMFFLNLVTGWLVLPWIALFVWAIWKKKPLNAAS